MVARSSRTLAFLSLIVLAVLLLPILAMSDDLESASAALAEQSFALLHDLSSRSNAKSNQLIGPIASLAGDADSLRQSLARKDTRAAQNAMAALMSDGATIDQALANNPKALEAEEWIGLKQQLDKLARAIAACAADDPHCKGSSGSSATAGSPAKESLPDSGGPHIVIASREFDGARLRLKGYLEGAGLKSAGLYEGSKELKAFKVDGVAGRQRVEFDLRLSDPSPLSVLRVVDSNGRNDQAPVLDAASEGGSEFVAAPSALASMLSAGGAGEPPPTTLDNTAEIPSHGPLLPSPSKRHTLGSRLADVHVTVMSLNRIANLPPTYEVVGRISGQGITRAGIYLDGRLIQTIPIVPGAKEISFDRQFRAEGGQTSIRAYSVGNRFIEEPLALDEASDPNELSAYANRATVLTAPISSAPVAIALSAIRPLGGGMYLVDGVISGANLATAGLYQNGVLVQNINLNSGMGGALGALAGVPRSVNFSVRFNPSAGPATIRAFDRTGAFAEQPILVAGSVPYIAGSPNSLSAGVANPLYGRSIPNVHYPSGRSFSAPLW